MKFKDEDILVYKMILIISTNNFWHFFDLLISQSHFFQWLRILLLTVLLSNSHKSAFLTNASSICPDKIFFVQDNIEIVQDKKFVQS